MKLISRIVAGLSAVAALISFMAQSDLQEAVKTEVKSRVKVTKVDANSAILATQEVLKVNG